MLLLIVTKRTAQEAKAANYMPLFLNATIQSFQQQLLPVARVSEPALRKLSIHRVLANGMCAMHEMSAAHASAAELLQGAP